MRSRAALLIAMTLLAAAVLSPAAAHAKSPPKGTYECVIGASSQLFGAIKIKSKSTYRYSRFGKTGTYKTAKKPKNYPGGPFNAYPISFKGGGLNKFKGYWFTSTTGTQEIALARPGSTFVNIACDN